MLQEEVQAQQGWSAQIETLLQKVATFTDPDARATTEELLQTLLAMYGEGLQRILELAMQDEPAGAALLQRCTEDEMVNSLLLLHNLHPIDIETRIAQALDEVRPYVQRHGGEVELLGVSENVAHLRLQGTYKGPATSGDVLKIAVEEAVNKAAPDLDGLQFEGVVRAPQPVKFMPRKKAQADDRRVNPASTRKVK